MTETRAAAIAVFSDPELDELDPPRGRCLLCGHPDARHQLWSVILRSPHSDIALSELYGVSVHLVRALRRLRPYQ